MKKKRNRKKSKYNKTWNEDIRRKKEEREKKK